MDERRDDVSEFRALFVLRLPDGIQDLALPKPPNMSIGDSKLVPQICCTVADALHPTIPPVYEQS